MVKMRFRVPDEVKREFDREFAGENKSRVIARMMMHAVEERRLQLIRARAVSVPGPGSARHRRPPPAALKAQPRRS